MTPLQFIKALSVTAILALSVFVLFRPYWVDRFIPIPIDIPVGMYYPWLNHSYGYPVRPPVKNSLLTDTVSQFWIWRNWAMDHLQEGRIAIWNPYSLSGYSLSPWFHTNLFSPVNLFYYLASLTDAMSYSVIAQFAISFIFSYHLGRYLTKSRYAGLFLGLAWTLSSYFVGWMSWASISLTLAFLPGTILFLTRLHKTNRTSDLVLLVFTLTALILAGHPQTMFYSLLIYLIWGLVHRVGLVKLALPLITATLFSAIAIVPSLDIIARSVRFVDPALDSVNHGFIPMGKLIYTLFSVNGFGSPATGNYFGGDYNFIEKLVNFGIIPLFLALYAFLVWLFTRRFDPVFFTSVILVALGFLLSTQYPLGWLIYHFDIPFLSTGPAGRSFILAIFGLVLLGTYGFYDLVKSRIDNSIFIPLSLAFLTTILTMIAIPLYAIYFIDQNPFAPIYSVIRTDYTVALRNNIYPLLIFTLFSVSVFVFTCFSRLARFRSLILIAVLTLVFVDGYIFFSKFTPFVDPKLYFPTTPALSFLQTAQEESPDYFRIERENVEVLPPNMWHVYGLKSISGYDPMAPISYASFLHDRGVQSSVGRYIENGHPGIDRVDELGVKYLLALKRDKNGILSGDGSIREWIDTSKWQSVYSEGALEVLENNTYRPPYLLTGGVSTDLITLTDYSDIHWQFDVTSSTEQNLILYQNHHPAWQAEVNGQPVEISTHQGTFQSIALPAGEQKVSFTYRNTHLVIGAIVSLVSLLLFGLYLTLSGLYRHYRPLTTK
jgi:hypothetical protein